MIGGIGVKVGAGMAALVVFVAVVGGASGGSLDGFLAMGPGGQANARMCSYAGDLPAARSKVNLTAEQKANARIIIEVAASMKLPVRAAVIAIATSLQEADLTSTVVSDHGTSFGPFQQRPVSGWGTREQVTDTNYAARAFYTRLVEVPRWDKLPLTEAAAIVQRPREDLRGEYAKHEVRAKLIVAALSAEACVDLTATDAGARGMVAVREALKWLGTAYSWGGGGVAGPSYGIGRGAGTKGFDCSGLTERAWAVAGERIGSTTVPQWVSGRRVARSEVLPGDLIFFAYNTSNPATIHHVGIVLDSTRMVHSPQTGDVVKISTWAGNAYREGQLIGFVRPGEGRR